MVNSYGIAPVYALNKTLETQQGVKGIYVSAQEWRAAYEYAQKHDPYTAGQMSQMLDARVGVNATGLLLPGSIVLKGGRLTKIGTYLQKAAKLPTGGSKPPASLPKVMSPVDGEMAGGNRMPKVSISSHTLSAQDIDNLIDTANRPINQQGISQATRAWSKHAGRPEGTFKPLVGSVYEQNRYVESWIRSVLTNPETKRTTLGRGGVSYRLPDGRGLVFEPDGRVNLLDPSRNIRNQ